MNIERFEQKIILKVYFFKCGKRITGCNLQGQIV